MVSFFCQTPDPAYSTALPHPSGSQSISTNYSLESVELLLTYKLCYKVNTKLYTGRISPSPSLPAVSRRSPSFIGVSKSYSSCLWENYRTVFIAIQTMDPHYAKKIQLIYATLRDSLAQHLTMRMGCGWLWGVRQLLRSCTRLQFSRALLRDFLQRMGEGRLKTAGEGDVMCHAYLLTSLSLVQCLRSTKVIRHRVV